MIGRWLPKSTQHLVKNIQRMEITCYGFFIHMFGACFLMGLDDPKVAIEIDNRSQISDEVKDATESFY